MSERKLPRILDRRMEPAGRVMKVERLDLEFSNGATRTYTRMHTHGLGAVIIVPMRDDRTVLLAREYACGLHHYELGLPKGRIEKGESPLQAADREMKEEIGYGARRLEELKALSLAPGYMTHVTHVVLARDLYAEKLEGDEPEALDVVPWNIDDLAGLTARADCTEGRSIAALYIAREFLREGKHT
jgi:ADP-ribose diphosphatase